MRSLVEAALLEQERRIIAAKPTDVLDKRSGRARRRPCDNCGRELHGNARRLCGVCR